MKTKLPITFHRPIRFRVRIHRSADSLSALDRGSPLPLSISFALIRVIRGKNSVPSASTLSTQSTPSKRTRRRR
jgi:hypothetical protein